MDLSQLATTIEQELTNLEGCGVNVLDEPSDDGAAFAFTLNDATGIVTCETNDEDIELATVTVAVFVAELEGAESDDLLNLLLLNGLFVDVSFVAHETAENVFDLFVQRRVPAEDFDPTDVSAHIEDISEQLAVVMSDDEE